MTIPLAPTKRPNPTLAKDLHTTLARLRLARTVDDKPEIIIAERRLNWLLEKLPTPAAST